LFLYSKAFCLISADIILISIKISGMPKSSWQLCVFVCVCLCVFVCDVMCSDVM
jgi:hypothetical protein